MVDYSKSKIYQISNTKRKEVYVGSTTQPLHKRFHQHKRDCKRYRCSSHILFDEDPDNCLITLIENYPCETKEEVLKRERYYIENMKCLNKIVPTRSHKEYYRNNVKGIKQKIADYRHKNRTTLNAKRKQYRKQNPELFKRLSKEYYERNKDKINSKIECECGVSVTKYHLQNHKKTKLHQKHLHQKQNNLGNFMMK